MVAFDENDTTRIKYRISLNNNNNKKRKKCSILDVERQRCNQIFVDYFIFCHVGMSLKCDMIPLVSVIQVMIKKKKTHTTIINNNKSISHEMMKGTNERSPKLAARML